jgi:uncharacterized protein YndB with AHSA1/START domain
VPDPTKAFFKVMIKAPIQAVWDEITRTDDVIPAFFNMRMHTTGQGAGSALTMRTRDGKYTGVVGKILEWAPPTRFAHTFKFTQMDDPECKVIYDLRQTAAGVEFSLTIEDLVPGTKTAKRMTSGAVLIVNTMKSVMETGKPSAGTRALFVLFRVLQPLTPKKCRTEYWT